MGPLAHSCSKLEDPSTWHHQRGTFHLSLVGAGSLTFEWDNFGLPTDVKGSACSARDLDSIPGSGISPGEGNGNPLQYSCLENSMDRGTWQATVHRVTESWTWLSDLYTIHKMNKLLHRVYSLRTKTRRKHLIREQRKFSVVVLWRKNIIRVRGMEEVGVSGYFRQHAIQETF